MDVGKQDGHAPSDMSDQGIEKECCQQNCYSKMTADKLTCPKGSVLKGTWCDATRAVSRLVDTDYLFSWLLSFNVCVLAFIINLLNNTPALAINHGQTSAICITRVVLRARTSKSNAAKKSIAKTITVFQRWARRAFGARAPKTPCRRVFAMGIILLVGGMAKRTNKGWRLSNQKALRKSGKDVAGRLATGRWSPRIWNALPGTRVVENLMDTTLSAMTIGTKSQIKKLSRNAVVKSTNAIQNCAKTTSIVLDMAIW